MMKLAFRLESVSYQSISLGVAGLMVGIVLALMDSATREPIVQAQLRDTQQSLEQVLPANYADNNLLEDSVKVTGPSGAPLTVYRARSQGTVKAVLFELSGKGYGGPISLVMAVDASGTVLGVRITHHTETPGLGDKIDADKGDWINSFAHKSFATLPRERWAVKKDGGEFDQFAGATITPRAVVNTVRQGLEFFNTHRAELMGAGAPSEPHHE
ncbi:MAG: electron transport complex subunit RsxG [Rhodocyclaceae bacterium]